MTAWLISHFIKNPLKTDEPEVRTAYGTLAAITGIVVNLLLSAAKFLMGTLSHSLAITADAVNNLSDAGGSIVTLITTRLAGRPVDQDHPFGHGRMEYLGSLAVGVLILVMGVELFKDGISSVMNPQPLTVSWVVLAVLVLSVLGKLWLYFFYKKMGSSVNNGTLLAAAKDSLGDVLSTSAVLLSVLLQVLFGWQLDGYIGLLVAIIVLKAGFDVCRETLDSLLGGKPDPEIVHGIKEMMLAHPEILGVHDLVLHDYGPGRCFGSAHAEVSADCDILSIHEVIDNAEHEIGKKYHMPMCIHMDPIVTDHSDVSLIRQKLSDFLKSKDSRLSLHDLRIVPGEGHTNVIFDVALPAGSKQDKKELLNELKSYAKELDSRYFLVVQFDTDYAGDEE